MVGHRNEKQKGGAMLLPAHRNAIEVVGAQIVFGIGNAFTDTVKKEGWLALGANNNFIKVPFGMPGNMPDCMTNRITSASVHVNDFGVTQLVTRKLLDEDLLVRVTARRLDFAIDPFDRDLNFTAGAEGYPSIASCGRPSELEIRDQLLCMIRGSFVYLADQKPAIMTLAYGEDGEITLTPTPHQVVIDYILKHGLAARNKASATWALRELNKLGVGRTQLVPIEARSVWLPK